MNAEEERNHWIRLFSRLDAAVSKHRRDKESNQHVGGIACFIDEEDEALHAAHDRILKAAAEGSPR